MKFTQPDKGWAWLVLVGSFGDHIVMGYCQYASGMIHIALLEKFNSGLLATTWITALFLALVSFAGPIASTIITKFSCKVSMITGSLMLTSGLVLTAFVEEIKWTFFTFGFLAGTGLGICYNTGLIVLAVNFEKKLNMACGIAVSGGGIGPFILTPIYQMIYETYSYTGFFLLLGGLALQNCVFGATFRVSKTEVESKRAKLNRAEGFKGSMSEYMEIVRSGSMLSVCLGFFLANISIFLVYIHYPEFCLHTNSSKMEISVFLSLAGMSSCVARILFGMANNSHNIDEIIMLFGIFSLLGLATILFPFFVKFYAAKIIYACLLGGYSGCCWTVVNTIIIQILGQKKLAHGVGYLMLYVGIGTFLGPPLAGFIIDFGGTYGDSFTVAGILLIVGAFCCLLSTTCSREEDTKQKYDDYEFTITVNDEKKDMLKTERINKNIHGQNES